MLEPHEVVVTEYSPSNAGIDVGFNPPTSIKDSLERMTQDITAQSASRSILRSLT